MLRLASAALARSSSVRNWSELRLLLLVSIRRLWTRALQLHAAAVLKYTWTWTSVLTSSALIFRKATWLEFILGVCSPISSILAPLLSDLGLRSGLYTFEPGASAGWVLRNTHASLVWFGQA